MMRWGSLIGLAILWSGLGVAQAQSDPRAPAPVRAEQRGQIGVSLQQLALGLHQLEALHERCTRNGALATTVSAECTQVAEQRTLARTSLRTLCLQYQFASGQYGCP